jgi:hypothetical protein
MDSTTPLQLKKRECSDPQQTLQVPNWFTENLSTSQLANCEFLWNPNLIVMAQNTDQPSLLREYNDLLFVTSHG